MLCSVGRGWRRSCNDEWFWNTWWMLCSWLTSAELIVINVRLQLVVVHFQITLCSECCRWHHFFPLKDSMHWLKKWHSMFRHLTISPDTAYGRIIHKACPHQTGNIFGKNRHYLPLSTFVQIRLPHLPALDVHNQSEPDYLSVEGRPPNNRCIPRHLFAFVTLTLTRLPWYMNLTYIWRSTCIPVKFLGQRL